MDEGFSLLVQYAKKNRPKAVVESSRVFADLEE